MSEKGKPKYLNMRHKEVIDYERAKRFLSNQATKTRQERDRFLVALLYLTSCRPVEAQKIKARDVWLEYVEINKEQQNSGMPQTELKGVKFRIFNAKTILKKKFIRLNRIVFLTMDTPFLEHILNYVNKFKDPDALLLPISTTRIKQIIYKMGEDEICPYTFRHNGLQKRADDGWTETELKQIKGGGSVDEYIEYKDPKVPRRFI